MFKIRFFLFPDSYHLFLFTADTLNGDVCEKNHSLIKHDLNSPHSLLDFPQMTRPPQEVISGV